MHKSLITVAMPVYNNEKTVATTIKSVLKQTYKNWELVIIDDASTDNSIDVISSFKDKRIKLIRHKKNKHIAKSLNEIIKIAKGEYFARIDGDDYCYPNRFETQINYLKNHPDVDLIGSDLLIVNKHGELLGKRTYNNLISNPYSNIYIAHPTFFGKTSFFQKYKYHCPPVTAQDQDLLFRSYTKSKFAKIDQILVCYQETLSLKKIVRARFDLMKSRFLNKGINFGLFTLFINQMLKIIYESFAIFTGLNYKMLRHRARPISKKEKAEWEKVKKLLEIN